jgi:uncharacterized NAD-dependent epimerase/dehydratase family protein
MARKRRMVILAEGNFSPLRSKTANGAIVYLRDEVVGIIDSTKAGKTAQDVLGYGRDIPVFGTLEECLRYGKERALKTNTLLIGIAPAGGRLPESWLSTLRSAIRHRLDIISGLHTFISDNEELVKLAKKCGVKISDLRRIPKSHEVVAKGTWRTRRAKTILSVGSDCNVGKMTTTLQVHNDFLHRGLKSDFVATGQTGMLIRGRGIAVDSIISDYVAGCIEREMDRSEREGYDYIFVEGQGALTHMGYSGVTLGLMHGVMPDSMILCHQPTRLEDDYGLQIPNLKKLVEIHEQVINIFRPSKVVCIGLNSIGLTDEESKEAAKAIEGETGLPTLDTFRFGGRKLADAVLNYFSNND